MPYAANTNASRSRARRSAYSTAGPYSSTKSELCQRRSSCPLLSDPSHLSRSFWTRTRESGHRNYAASGLTWPMISTRATMMIIQLEKNDLFRCFGALGSVWHTCYLPQTTQHVLARATRVTTAVIYTLVPYRSLYASGKSSPHLHPPPFSRCHLPRWRTPSREAARQASAATCSACPHRRRIA